MKNIEIVWQNFEEPKELLITNYGADVLGKIMIEIEKYLSTDTPTSERDYFESKIQKLKKIKITTDQKTKQDLKQFVRKNEEVFNEVGYFDKLWPELSALLD